MIRALVIDDSAYNRVTIARMLQSSGKIDVVATAVNGEDGIKQVLRHQPDVISLDLQMPVMDGFAFLRWLMQNRPTAVIVVSSRARDRSVFKALALGALDFVVKPGGRISPRLEEIEGELVAKVLQIGGARMDNVRRRIESDGVGAGPAADTRPHKEALRSEMELVAIGSSTGGPPALQRLFEKLPLLPVPIVVAQHMPPTFTKLFAERVDRLTSYRVKEVEDAEKLEPGSIYVAPGGMQTEVHSVEGSLWSRVLVPGKGDIYAPSVDRLFSTASDSCGKRMIAVVMTGMGDDGAKAIRRVRERGGKTIAESSETAIIFGMPNEAIKTGAVELILPLEEIAQAIERLCTSG